MRNFLNECRYLFHDKNCLGKKKGKSATRAVETASLSVQPESANSSQVAKMQLVDTAYSEASGDQRFLTLSGRYIGYALNSAHFTEISMRRDVISNQAESANRKSHTFKYI